MMEKEEKKTTSTKDFQKDAYIMPSLCMAIPITAFNVRFTKSSMLESIRADYIDTARAKGATERTVIWKHALKKRFAAGYHQYRIEYGRPDYGRSCCRTAVFRGRDRRFNRGSHFV
ncbi:MAG: ABC transporter permease subunit [Clostridiales bacterium]|nr:ABC transporter permease subunit [Clostridiales bacterium]